MSIQRERADEARRWIADNALIIDTETTGFDRWAEIVEIGVIDCGGKVLFDKRVKPTVRIPREAERIHGISNAMVRNEPSWAEIHEEFLAVIRGRRCVIYNAKYDVKLLRQSAAAHGLRAPLTNAKADCAMKLYSDFFANASDARWKKLEDAVQELKLIRVGKAHSALNDCRATLGVIQAMARH